jgi:hypothetical protein
MSQSDQIFLQKSHCGSEGKKIYVCCAEQPIEVPTTTSTTTKRPETTTPENDETPEAWRESLKGKVPSSPVCGVEVENRIIGGGIVPVGGLPWAVLLQYLIGQ